MKKTLKKLLTDIFGIIIGFYFMFAFIIFTPYYNWNYANTHGFIKWIFFGEVVATGKAIAWPYFVFFTESNDNTASHVSQAINYANKATAIINKGTAYQQISQSDIEDIINYCKKALQEAEQADILLMNKHYEGFGNHFRDEFIQGLRLYIISYETNDTMLSINSQILLENWGKWYSTNIDGIRSK